MDPTGWRLAQPQVAEKRLGAKLDEALCTAPPRFKMQTQLHILEMQCSTSQEIGSGVWGDEPLLEDALLSQSKYKVMPRPTLRVDQPEKVPRSTSL